MADPEKDREINTNLEADTDPEVVAHSDDSEDAPCIAGHSGSCGLDAAE